jgi:hypothetical protein
VNPDLAVYVRWGLYAEGNDMSYDLAQNVRSHRNFIIKYKALNGGIEIVCLSPHFESEIFRIHCLGEEYGPSAKCCWLGRGKRDGQWLTDFAAPEGIRWVLWHIDFFDLRRSFDETEPSGHGGTDLPDSVHGEEVSERDAAAWIDENGYDLPTTLMGHTLVGKPEPGAPSIASAYRPSLEYKAGSQVEAAGPPTFLRAEQFTQAVTAIVRTSGGPDNRPDDRPVATPNSSADNTKTHPTRWVAPPDQADDSPAGKERRVSRFSDAHPNATSEEIGKATRIPPQTVRRMSAWKAHQAKKRTREDSGSVDAMELTEEMLDCISVRDRDPSEVVEQEEILELYERPYLEQATTRDRDEYQGMEQDEKANTLWVWKEERSRRL